jgi:hypothetical protein
MKLRYYAEIKMGYNTYKRPWVIVDSKSGYPVVGPGVSVRRFGSKAAVDKAVAALNAKEERHA